MKQDDKLTDNGVGWGIGRRRALKLATALPLGGLTAACSGLVPGQGPPPDLFRLSPKSTFREDLPTVAWQLVLETPIANAALNTTRIGLQRNAAQMEYYARAGWTDRAPLMVQNLVIESFENTNRILAVGREAVSLRADYILKTDLREFQAIYYDGPPRALVTINAKLVKMPQRVIVGSQSFTYTMESTADRLEDIISAFDQALGKVLKRLVEWTLVTGDEVDRSA